MKERKRVSDIISEDDINNWNNGDVVTIKAGTGAGKSYFVKNKLYDIAKKNGEKILMLIHRRNCVDQFRSEIIRDDKTDVIDIATYQLLESKYLAGEEYDLSEYDYIVSDEFHFFLSDSVFNKFTDISLDQILNDKNSIKIFMSATGKIMRRYINNIENISSIDYSLPVNYDFIDNLYFFNEKETLENLLDKLVEKNEKAIVFINSAKDAYEMHNKYEQCSFFNCSKGNVDYYKYVNEGKVQKMLDEEGFKENFIFTTTTMDSGVNITDTTHSSVDNVVLDIFDPSVLIQSLGRRRVDYEVENDKFDVYIRNIKNRSLGGRIRKMKESIEKVNYFLTKGETCYITKYGRNPDVSGILYEVIDKKGNPKKKVNMLMYSKAILDIANTELMIKIGYDNYIANELNRSEDYVRIEELRKEKNLEEYLESVVGNVMLRATDREELINKINVRDGNSNRVLKGLDTLNAKLEETGSNFTIRKFSTSRMVKGKKKNYNSAWKVMRLVDN